MASYSTYGLADFQLTDAQRRMHLTDYPYTHCARPLSSSAGGVKLAAMLQSSLENVQAAVTLIAGHMDALALIPRDSTGPIAPLWDNTWFPPFDGAALYSLIAENKPRRYIEVGSGISTRFARQAIVDLKLDTRIISIDPHPREDVSGLCDEFIVSPMEDVSEAFWRTLDSTDMVFIDNSHRSFPGSDVTVFFTEVLPALPAGVLYGIHDIFLPNDYPSSWNPRFYNEQYLLMMYLLGGASSDEIVLPVAWAASQPALMESLAPIMVRIQAHGLSFHGGSFWLRRG